MTLFEEALMMLDHVRHRAARRLLTDEGINELIEEAVKRLQADHEALMAENTELSGLLVRATTESERLRIATAQPDEGWHRRVENWRGEDYMEGASE